MLKGLEEAKQKSHFLAYNLHYLWVRGEAMREKLKKLIQKEDGKNPLTDTEIAQRLKIRREEATMIRNSLEIPDSRERRKVDLLKKIELLMKKAPNRTMVDVTRSLNASGYEVSRCTVVRYAAEIRQNSRNDQKQAQVVNTVFEKSQGASEPDVFSKLVGHRRSLKGIIQLAKAAVLYPPHGLHTIITGPTGVGKSELAECMYEFAVASGVFEKKSPFVVFNAADYAENQQLLLSQLFGHIKGAFTGADMDKMGLVEKADGGILFIDEIHRLPHEGQEILFQLIDKGKVRRLGETKLSTSIKVMLISATSEPLESYLLTTFKRRIPMVIEIPDLTSRPLVERHHIINNFFVNEAHRIGIPILVKADVYKALMLYKCHGNLGQLRSDIQVACARGLLNKLAKQQDNVVINISEVSEHVMKGLIDIRDHRDKVEKYVLGDVKISPDANVHEIRTNDSIYQFPEEIYRYTEERYLSLLSEGIEVEAINRIVGGEVEIQIQQYIKSMKTYTGDMDLRELVSVVGKQILLLTEDIINIAEKRFGKLDGSLKFSLAIHLKATISRLKEGKKIQNNNLKEIINNYPQEFTVAREISDYLEQTYSICLPEEELGFIAIYLNSGYRKNFYHVPKVGVFIIAHGRVASAVAEVVNKLLGVMNHVKALDMHLDKSPQETIRDVIKMAEEIDEGRGIIILVDMGSLAYLGEFITKETGIETRTLTRVDTVLAIEVTRRATLPDLSIDDIMASIRYELSGGLEYKEASVDAANDKKPTILIICVTGSGTAKIIRNKIVDAIPGIELKFHIETKGIVEFPKMDIEISRIKKRKNIIAIVSTIHLVVTNIHFVNAQEVLKNEGMEKFKDFIMMKSNSSKDHPLPALTLDNLIQEKNIYVNLPYDRKKDVLTYLCKELIKGKAVKDEYLDGVFSREELFTTELEGGVAIPHSDETSVLESSIAIATLKKPILWENKYVNIIVMLAVDKNCFSALSSMLGYIITEDFKKIAQLTSAKDIKEAIMDACKEHI
jgi:transcriptional regulator with AAA-type ATPase domain/transcriptional regulatory protein LevR